MMNAANIERFFLKEHAFNNEFEKRKTQSLLYISITSFFFFVIMLVMLEIAGNSRYVLAGNVIAVSGTFLTLWCIKKQKINEAGNVLIGTLLIVILVTNIFDDYFSAKVQNEYKLYVSLVALLATYMLSISFNRSRQNIFLIALIGIIISTLHAYVIWFHPLTTLATKNNLWQHWAVCSFALLTSAFISQFLIAYTEDLLLQNMEDTLRIKLQNEKLERTVEKRDKVLKTTNENLQDFSFIVSHDLKEPLRNISGFVNLIERRIDKTQREDLKEFIEYVIEGVAHMNMLISDLLTYSQLNMEERNFEKIEVKKVVLDAMNLLSGTIQKQQALIDIKEMPVVMGEKHLLLELYKNLISNAIKYRQPESIPALEFGVIEKDDKEHKRVFYVKDNGIGIAEKYKKTIFHAFKRLHTKTEYEGTGVGLAICQKVVRIHGGEIWVESEVGIGSTFFFTLAE